MTYPSSPLLLWGLWCFQQWRSLEHHDLTGTESCFSLSWGCKLRHEEMQDAQANL